MSDNWKKKVNEKDPKPEEILGADVNQSLHHLVGYVWAEGNQKRVFPSELFMKLIQFVYDQHNDEIKELKDELRTAEQRVRDNIPEQLRRENEELRKCVENYANLPHHLAGMAQKCLEELE